MFKHGIFDVPQGIGDIVWLYRKLAPYFENLSFNVLLVGNKNIDVQRRSQDWLVLFPKIQSVSFKFVDPLPYKQFIYSSPSLKYILDTNKGKDTIKGAYIVNEFINNQIPLEEIDPGMSVDWNFTLPVENFDIKTQENYLLVYASHETLNPRNSTWTPQQWVYLIKKYLKHIDNVPVYLTGAQFDSDATELIYNLLITHGINTEKFIGLPPKKFNYLMSSASYFIGYQSGLNMIADIFDIPQLMIYFPKLHKIKENWLTPKNRNRKMFNWGYFNENIDAIFDRIPK